MTAATVARHRPRHRKPSLPRRVLSRLTDGRERDDTPAESSRTARGDGTPPPGTQVAGRQAATGRRAVESRADPRAAGATASRGAQPPAPGLLRRCRIAALWLLAVLGDWWLNWRTWRAERRRAEDIEIARHDAQMARVEDHGVPPAVAAECAVTALTEVIGQQPAPPPALPCEPLYPIPGDDSRFGDHLTRKWQDETGQFEAVIRQMQPPARQAGTF